MKQQSKRYSKKTLASIGKTFNRLTVVGLVDKGDRYTYAECKCICGNTKVIRLGHINSPKSETKSCGCYRAETGNDSLSKNRLQRKDLHGDAGTHFWHKWNRMKDRAQRKVFPYNNVTLSKEWRDSYLKFKEDMYQSYLVHLDKYGERNTTLDRIDNSIGYSKENCRWATYKMQVSNRTNSRWIEYNGEQVYLPKICKDVGIKLSTVASRIYRGWDPESAVKLPVRSI